MEQTSLLSKIFKIILIINLIALDLLVAYLLYKFPARIATQSVAGGQITNTKTEYIDRCGEECKVTIASEVARLKLPQPSLAPVPVVSTKTKTRVVSYVTVPGSGSSTSNTWANITGSDFYFDPADYPGLKEVYFEANIRLFNGNGMVFVRLLDSTHGIGVQGSEVQTNNQVSTLVTSGKVSFWAGKNLIRVQTKSLTADTAIFDSGRLRIVTEN